MCGRFEQHLAAMQEWRGLLTSWPEQLPIRFSVRPSEAALTLSADGWRDRRWSLLPRWSRQPKVKFSTFNARVEGVADKPAFRDAWRSGQRCLVPVSAYFEWTQGTAGKQCYRVSSAQPMLLAGLWEVWSRGDQRVDSFTILTTPAPASMAWLHPRAPLLLAPGDVDIWLRGSVAQAAAMLGGEAPYSLNAEPLAGPDQCERQGSLFP
ncbi:MAG: SOS response-associated peptidase [Spongiibacter sp.]|nr:SOS response-associated peptidase [Spongiibacter sp.]